MTLGICALGELAQPGLGFKSLQNHFFYLDRNTIESYDIEKIFLRPIYRFKDLAANNYWQTAKASQYLFFCNRKESDLRGSGALRYIRAMASRPAVEKKQTGKRQSIQEVLEAQSGGLWYAPKAKPNQAHIWVRKAYGSVFAPFLFSTPRVVDQRCNFLEPKPGIDWEVIAAILSSSLFTLAVESSGGSSLGAGALEVPTKKLPEVLIPDVRHLTNPEQSELKLLAQNVWEKASPIDWRAKQRPGPENQKLDSWFLAKLATTATKERLYKDIADTCRARLRMAAEKEVRVKAGTRHDVEAVAAGIASAVRPLLDGRLFPEGFGPSRTSFNTYDLSHAKILAVECQPVMTNTLLTVTDADSHELLLKQELPRHTAEVLVRALLMGRRIFRLPMEDAAAAACLDEFQKWFPSVLHKIEEGCRSSALGTRFEDEVTAAALKKLSLDQRMQNQDVYGTFLIGA